MTSIDSSTQFEAGIYVNGKPLPEHNDPDAKEEDNLKTCYLEVESDQFFEVRVKTKKGTHFLGDGIKIKVLVDGQYATGRVLLPTHSKKHDDLTIFEGVILECGRLAKFRFTSLEIVPELDLHSGVPRDTDGLGTISVQITHVRNLDKPVRRANKFRLSEKSRTKFRDKPDFVKEKDIKGQALSHSVGYAKATRIASTGLASHTQPTSNVDLSGKPAVMFNFHYRSIAALKAMHIIPRTPSPPPLEQRDAASLSVDDIKELQRRLQATGEARKIKREGDDADQRPRKLARHSGAGKSQEMDDDDIFQMVATTPNRIREQKIIELDED